MYKEMLLSRLFKKYRFQGRVLEVGCGTGEFTARLSEMGMTGVGIDLSEDSLRAARARLKNGTFELHQKDVLEFEGGPFDCVFIFEVLEHIEQDQRAMERLHGFLAPGGLLLLSVPARQKLFSPEDHFQGHVRRYERDELQGKLRAASFEILEFWCYNPLPYLRRFLLKEDDSAEKSDLEIEQRTKESAHDMHSFTQKWVNRLYPIYSRAQFVLRIQDLFLHTDFGAHYLVLARRANSGDRERPDRAL